MTTGNPALSTQLRLRVAIAVDWVGHKLHLPGAIQFYLCQWVGRETVRRWPS